MLKVSPRFNAFSVVLFAIVFGVARVQGAPRNWSVLDGEWSTSTSATNWNGHAFSNGDSVTFEDLLGLLGGDATNSVVRVVGSVYPSSLTFNNAATQYYAIQGAAGQIGKLQGGSTPNVTKSGAGVASIEAPYYVGNITVNAGVLWLKNIMNSSQRIEVAANAELHVASTNVNLRANEVVLGAGAKYYRDGTFTRRSDEQLVLPLKGTPTGGLWYFEHVVDPHQAGWLVTSNATVAVSGAFNASLRVADPSAANLASVTLSGGGSIPMLDVARGSVVLDKGAFTIGNYVANTNSAASFTIGGQAPQVAINGNWNLGLIKDDVFSIAGAGTEVTVAGDVVSGVGRTKSQSVKLEVSNRAKLTINGDWAAADKVVNTNRLFTASGSEIDIKGAIDFTRANDNSATYVLVTNGTVRVNGIHFSSAINRVQQITVAPGGVFLLGGDNTGAPGDSKKSFNMMGGTIRFMADTTLQSPMHFQRAGLGGLEDPNNIYSQMSTLTNVLDSCGHSVQITKSIFSDVNTINAWQRCEFIDSSEGRKGRITFSGPSNWLSNNPSITGANGPYPTWGMVIKSGAFRLDVSDSKNKGTALEGGILELPSAYESYKNTTQAPVTLYSAFPGSVIRVFKDIANTTAITNLNVASLAANSGRVVSPETVFANVAFELVDKATGELIPGATFRSERLSDKNVIRMDWTAPATSAPVPVAQTWAGGAGTWSVTEKHWNRTQKKSSTDSTLETVNGTNFVAMLDTVFDSASVVTFNYSDTLTNTLHNAVVRNLILSTPVANQEITLNGSVGFVRARVLTNTLAKTTFNVPLSVDTQMAVMSGDLTATNLYTRASWIVKSGARLRLGFARDENTFSVMTPFIENRGELIYDMHGRTERMDSELIYQADAPTARYVFVNGTMVLDQEGSDYLKRVGNTNVWFSTGATLALNATNVLGSSHLSPVGLSGGRILANEDFTFSKGIVCRGASQIELAHDKNVTFKPGTEISVMYDATNTNNYSKIQHISDQAQAADCTSKIILDGASLDDPFVFHVETGATLELEMALDGQGTLRKTGGGTLIIDSASDAEGFLKVEEGTVELHNSMGVGFMQVSVNPGAQLTVAKAAMPIRLTRSVAFEDGAILRLGAEFEYTGASKITTEMIEALNPVPLVGAGRASASTNVIVIAKADETGVEIGSNGVVEYGADTGLKRYTKAKDIDQLYVDLFGDTQALVWMTDKFTGTWFSKALDAEYDSASFWTYEQTHGETNFCNDKRPSVRFISAADVVANTDEVLSPLSVSFTTNVTAALNGVNTLSGSSVLGSAADRVSIRASGAVTVTNALPTYLSSVIAEGGAVLTMADLRTAPTAISASSVSRLRLATAIQDSVVTNTTDSVITVTAPVEIPANVCQGQGVLSKFGASTLALNMDDLEIFTPKLAIESGTLQITGDDDADVVFDNELTFSSVGGGLSILQNLRKPDATGKPTASLGAGATFNVKSYAVLVSGALGLNPDYPTSNIENCTKDCPLGFQDNIVFRIDGGVTLTNYCPFVAQTDQPSTFSLVRGPDGQGLGQVVQATSFGELNKRVTLNVEAGTMLAALYHTTQGDAETIIQADDINVAGIIGGNGKLEAYKTLRFEEGMTFFIGFSEFGNGATNNMSLLMSATNDKAMCSQTNNNAKIVVPMQDGTLNVNMTLFGSLKTALERCDQQEGLVVLRFRGVDPADLPAYKFKLMYAAHEDNRPGEYALSSVPVTDELGTGVDVKLVKASGVVFVISSSNAGWDARPAGLAASLEHAFETNVAEVVGGVGIVRDHALIPTRFNSGTNLHTGAVIRDAYPEKTDGVTTDQMGAQSGVGVNDDYWFWFTGSNGCWSEPEKYELNLYCDAAGYENASSFVQFSVTNQVFYGDVSDLAYGELGFYVAEMFENGQTTTNLIARVASADTSVAFDVSGVTDPWLAVSAKIIPGVGYELQYGTQKKTLTFARTMFPRRLIVTGVAPVDNLYISLGDPSRYPLVYVCDVTQTNATGRVEQALDVQQEVQDIVVSAVTKAGYSFTQPTSADDVVDTLYLTFEPTRMINDQERKQYLNKSGSYYADMAYMLGLQNSVTCDVQMISVKVSDEKTVQACPLTYTYNFGIVGMTINDDMATVSVALSDKLDGSNHLGQATELPIKGYIIIEGLPVDKSPTDGSSPFDVEEGWEPVAKSPTQTFKNGINEIPIDGIRTINCSYFRASIVREDPVAQ